MRSAIFARVEKEILPTFFIAGVDEFKGRFRLTGEETISEVGLEKLGLTEIPENLV